MWDVLSADFDQTITKKDAWKCGFQYKTRDIIVFHDSVKAFKNLEYTLPRVLIIDKNGFQYEVI
jgi:hypothetical protein